MTSADLRARALRAPPYPPELYAVVHRGNPGDIDYYRRVCSGARTALELGCGTGRIAHAVAADGVEVLGIDIDPSLLAEGPRGPATCVRGDMADLSLGRRFDRVIVPYSGIYCLPSEPDQLRCLRSVREHLEPGGLLVFDAYCADGLHGDATQPDVDDEELVATVELNGRRWSVYEQSGWEPGSQLITARYRHVPDGGGEPVEAFIVQRYLLAEQVGPLLSRAGLQLVALQGGFDQSAFDPDDSALWIAVACRDDAEL